MYDLTKFTLKDMVECGLTLRQFETDADSLETVSQRIIRYFYEQLLNPQTQKSACALVRLFVTQPYQSLAPDQQAAACRVLAGKQPAPHTRCLTLMATAGYHHDWNFRQASQDHQAIPLISDAFIAKSPMIAQLFRQFGVDTSVVVEPKPDLILDLAQRKFNIFYVPTALGSPYIPGQRFVDHYGVQSVLGFGSMMPSGNIFAAIMFLTLKLPKATAEMFGTLALNVKAALFPFDQASVLTKANSSPDSGDRHVLLQANEQLRSQVATLTQILEVSEQTTLKQSERLMRAITQLSKAKTQAESANQAKSRFLSNMSHELRTPLNSILGYAQTLQQDPNLTPTQTKGLNVIEHSGNHLLTLINDILDLSKIEARKLELKPRPFPLRALITNVVEMVRMSIQKKSLAFDCYLSDALPEKIVVDDIRLRQVLLNLLSNAVKFTHQGGVTLRVSMPSAPTARLTPDAVMAPDSEHPVDPTPTDQNVHLRFEVNDTGVGIPTEALAHIFQPFEQVGDVAQRSQGTGLGLSISQQLVELMGGKLQVESNINQGSTFWFEAHFPIITSRNMTPSSLARKILGYQGPKRLILIADDHQDNHWVLHHMLEPLGFNLNMAADGQQAVELAQRLHPDLILMDLFMPFQNGFEAAARIRQIPGLQAIPIIAISASVQHSEQAASLRAGCNGFLPKPVNAQELFKAIADQLSLTWIYREPEEMTAAPVSPPEVAPEDWVIPPPPEMAVLQELAQWGNMKNICDHANYLEQLDRKYRPFAHRLKTLANHFQEEAIVALVDKYLALSANP